MKKNLFLLTFLCISLVAQSQITSFPYAEGFSSGEAGWSTDGLWEHGTATTTNLSSGSCKGWVTNLTGNYPSATTNYLYSPIFDFSSLGATPAIKFQISYDTETNFDGAWLEVSIDSGATWTKMDSASLGYNTANGDDWWDGNSGGWLTLATEAPIATAATQVQFRFYFDSDGSINREGIAVDNIYIADSNTVANHSFSSDDLELVEILSPVSGANLSANEPIIVVVRNNGATTVNFPDYAVCYNGDIPQACNSTVTNILSGSTDTLTLLGTADLSAAGTYNLDFYLSTIASELNTCNDSLSIQVTNIPVLSSFPYTENFEAGTGSWLPSGTLWQHGTPTTTGFLADNTPCIENAFVTNLTGNYPSNTNNFLTSPVFDFSGFTSDPTIRFDINRYLENCCDEVWMEMSTDGGATWTKVLGPGSNWYNDITNDWWDSNTNGWQTAQTVLVGAAGQANVQVRFAFSSDGSGVREGVGIDNIYVGDGLYVDLELVEILSPVSGGNLSANEPIIVVVRNNGAATVNFSDYAICVQGDLPQSCESTITSIAGASTDTITLTLTTADLSNHGTYNITAYVSTTGNDLNSCNDSLSIQVTNIPVLSSFPYTENFEAGTGSWTPSDTLWQHGIPTSTNFLADNTPCMENAFVTNLTGDYTSNASNFLTSPAFDFSGFTSDPTIRFDINRYLENCCDEVWMEMSTDAGATWTKVLGPGNNWYNDTGNNWWDSNTNGWQAADAVLVGAAGHSAVQVRFVFDSDGSVQREGVGIDNIYIGDNYVDLEFVELISPTSSCGVLSANEPITVVIANNGPTTANFADYAICYNGDIPQACESTVNSIAPYSRDTITLLGTVDLSTAGTYNIDFYTSSASDAKTCNDTVSTTIVISEQPMSNLGADTTSCGSITLDGGTADNYNWSTGDTTNTIVVGTSGPIYLELSSAGCPTAYDTIIVTVNTLPSVDLGADTTICAGQSLSLDAGAGFSAYDWSTGTSTQMIMATTTDNYSVTITDGNGCTDSDTIAVMVNTPSIDLGADTAICAGQSLNLDAGAGFSTYNWSTGANTQMIMATTTDNYSVMATDANGCIGADTIAVIVNAAPSVDLGIDTTICAGQSLSIDAGAGFSTYNWSTGATTQMISATIADDYSVMITDANGCTAVDTIVVTVSTCVGIIPTETLGDVTFNVYPNPNKGQFNVNIEATDLTDLSMELLDLNGRRVFQKELGNHTNTYNTTVQVNELPAGVYILRMTTNLHNFTKRIIIE